jgi:hypothetical protein
LANLARPKILSPTVNPSEYTGVLAKKIERGETMFGIRKSMAVGMFIACFSGFVWAQGGATGAITGTVQDASGAVLSGAKVDIVSEATRWSAI